MHDTTHWWNQHHKETQDAFHCAYLSPVESHPLPLLLPFLLNPWFSLPSLGFKQDPPPDPKPRTSLHLSLPPPDGKSSCSHFLRCPPPPISNHHHHHLSGMISGFCDVVVRYCGYCRVSWGASRSLLGAALVSSCLYCTLVTVSSCMFFCFVLFFYVAGLNENLLHLGL